MRTLNGLPGKARVGNDEVLAVRAGDVLNVADDFSLGRTALTYAGRRWDDPTRALLRRGGEKTLQVSRHKSPGTAFAPYLVLGRDMPLRGKLFELLA